MPFKNHLPLHRPLIGIVFFILTVILGPAHADNGEIPLDKFLQNADAIVEGIVVTQSNKSERNVPGYINGQYLKFGFGYVKDSIFQISKIYKGAFTPDQNIHLFTYPHISADVSDLQARKTYLLFLKKHPLKNGYHILESGKGAWMIFDYEGKKKLRAWHHYPTLRPADAYPDYDVFLQNLQQRLAQTAKEQ